MSFHGIIPPLATPFKDNEDLDIERLKWFIEQQIEAGVHGIFVLGTNSEFYAMDEAEKQQVIAVAVEQNGKISGFRNAFVMVMDFVLIRHNKVRSDN